MTDANALDTRTEAVELRRANEVCRVVTATRCDARPEKVWQGILYYEQIPERPPFLLRILLPVPIRTIGSKSAVGDEALCEYVGGHLRKRVTEIEPARLYRFSVVEQSLPIGDLRLHGGAYVIREVPEGGSELSLETQYQSGRRPRWLWKPIEAVVCHAFHRHILRAMVRAIDAPASLPPSE